MIWAAIFTVVMAMLIANLLIFGLLYRAVPPSPYEAEGRAELLKMLSLSTAVLLVPLVILLAIR